MYQKYMLPKIERSIYPEADHPEPTNQIKKISKPITCSILITKEESYKSVQKTRGR